MTAEQDRAYFAGLNAERAERGRAVLERYRVEHDQGEDEHYVCSDLLADLMHAVPASEFELSLDKARRNYSAEVREANTGRSI